MRLMIAVFSTLALLLCSSFETSVSISLSSVGVTNVAAASTVQVGPGISSQPVAPTDPVSATVPGETDLDPAVVVKLVLDALNGKNWALLACGGVLLVVYLTRRLGASRWPWLSSDLGGIVLSFVTAVAFALVSALSLGQPFTLSVLLGAVLAATSASGLWSWGKKINTAVVKSAIPQPRTPEEAAAALGQVRSDKGGSR